MLAFVITALYLHMLSTGSTLEDFEHDLSKML